MKILILSDIHGNWAALQAVLAAEPDVDQILCLGDLVNHGPQPAQCVAWAMKTLTGVIGVKNMRPGLKPDLTTNLSEP
jgi:predicted phosphodiesterase